MTAPESRVKKSLLNARVNLIFYFLALALSFFSRKIFLDTLGADFVGLTGTLQNLLGFLNLAELGIGSAIGYVLYQPLYERDEAKINEIISVFGYLYRWIGCIILGVGGVFAGFLPLIFPQTGFDLGIIYFAYGSFLASSLIGYFANYKQTLLGADQKNYLVTAYFQTATIVKTLIQMASAYYTKSYYLWVAIELTFGVIYSFILNWKVNQVYPWLKSEVRQGKELFKKYPEVMKYTKQLFVHKIALFFQYHTTPFFIYAFTTLQTVAYYSNYTIVVDKLAVLVTNILESTNAGVGNLIAENNKAKIHSIYWELTVLRYFIANILVFSIYFLISPFIALWLGEKYILSPVILLLLLCNIFLGRTRGANDQFLFGYGLFHDVWAPCTETIINVVITIIGGSIWGLPGVLAGGISSMLIIVHIWKPYFLFSQGFKMPVSRYWKNIVGYLLLISISMLITYHSIQFITIKPYHSFTNWILYSICIVAIHSTISLIVFTLASKAMRRLTKRFNPLHLFNR